MKKFYVCSYGGSGSKMLCSALSKYGESVHIHSRKPPNKLEYVGVEKGGTVYHEWFNGIPIPEDELHNYYVIYIYRNPSFSIPSRFWIPGHLNNIQTKDIKLDEVIKSGEDLYKLREFHNNYIKKDKNINNIRVTNPPNCLIGSGSTFILSIKFSLNIIFLAFHFSKFLIFVCHQSK